MKRSLSLILAGILLASLAGCGGDSPEVPTDTGIAETDPACNCRGGKIRL